MRSTLYSNELFTIFLMIGLLAITLAKLTAPKRFEDFLEIIGNSKYLKIHNKDLKFFDQFDALLFFNLILGLGTFSYILYRRINNVVGIDTALFFKLIIGIGSFILIKVLIERLIASAFKIDKLMDRYLFQKISYRNYLGLLLIPINAVLLFFAGNSPILIYTFIGILIVVNFIGFITSFKTYQSLIISNLFYFILYLCALEIAPYIILYKVFIS